jgi:hypothetical protein
VVRSTIDTSQGSDLGIGLTKLASASNGRGLVLVSDVFGAATEADPAPLQVRDVLMGVLLGGGTVKEQLTGLNYNLLVEAIGQAKAQANGGKLIFEANCLVKRAPITIQVLEEDGTVKMIQAFLAGKNLQWLLQQKGVQVYNLQDETF